MKKIKLPTWLEVNEKKKNGEELNPLENFIFIDEPPTNDTTKDWRESLSDLIEFVRKEK